MILKARKAPMLSAIFMFIIVLMLTVSSEVYAQIQTGIHITIAGTELDGQRVYVGITENPNSCVAGGIYFTESTGLNKALSVALAAKASDKTIRIDFDQPGGSGNICYGRSIYME